MIQSNSIEFLCIDFTLMDTYRTKKQNVFVMMDCFLTFVQAVSTPNQTATTVAKRVVREKDFLTRSFLKAT